MVAGRYRRPCRTLCVAARFTLPVSSAACGVNRHAVRAFRIASPIVLRRSLYLWPCTIVVRRNARQYGIKYVSALYPCRVAQMSNGRQRRCRCCSPGPLPSTAAGQWRRAPGGAETAKLYITKSFGCANITSDPATKPLCGRGNCAGVTREKGPSAGHANVPGREAKPARPQSGGNARRAVLIAQSPTRVSGDAGVIVCIHYAAPPKIWPWLPT